jgi:hypothetical protein
MTTRAREDVFAERTRLIATWIAILSLVATVVAIVWGRKLSSPTPTARDSFSSGPLGHRALFETMKGLGISVVRWQQGDPTEVRGTLFVIEPDAPFVEVDGIEVDLAELIDARLAAGRKTVIVLPKWSQTNAGYAEVEDDTLVDDLIEAVWPGAELRRHGAPDAEPTVQTATGERVHAVRMSLPFPTTINAGDRAALVGPNGNIVISDAKRLLYVVADADLVHNFNVQREHHALFWSRFVRDELDGAAIVFDETFHGHRHTRSIAEALGEWPGILLLGQAFLVGIAILLMSRVRFGAPIADAVAHGRGPREAITVSAMVLGTGQPLGKLGVAYVEHAIDDLHRRLGLPETGSALGKAKAIDDVAERRGKPRDAEAALEMAHAVRSTRGRAAQRAYDAARRIHVHRASLLGRAVHAKVDEEA